MSGFLQTASDMLDEVGWIIGLGMFLVFIGMLGYALLCAADEDDNEEEDRT